MLRAIITSGLVTIIATLAVAQEAERPGPEHQKLQTLVGDWDATMDLGGQKYRAKASYKPIGQMWVVSEFQGDLAGNAFQGHGVDGYDLRKKKYVSSWVDSMSSALTTMEGDFDQAAKTFTMIGEMREPDGSVNKIKSTTELKDPDHMVFKMHVLQPDGTAQLMFTIEYSRRK